MDGDERITPQDIASNIQARRRAEEITQEQLGEFGKGSGWPVSTIWGSPDAAPYGIAFCHRIDGERVSVVYENTQYILNFRVINTAVPPSISTLPGKSLTTWTKWSRN